MSDAYEIPPELRPWCEATAPKYTAKQWEHARWAVDAAARGEYFGHCRHLAEYRALLAYADEVAAGLDEHSSSMLVHAVGNGHRNHYCLENDGTTRSFRCWSAMVDSGIAERGRNINDNRDAVFRATDYGRYIAGRAAALRGEG